MTVSFLDLIKNVNLLTAAVWVVIWNILCGIGIYFDGGAGPIETLPGAAAMVGACLFALVTSLLGLFTTSGRRLASASYGEYEKVAPTLRLLAFVSGVLTLAGTYHAINIAWSQA